MFKAEVTKNNIVTNIAYFPTQLEAESWLNSCVANNIFGKPQREALEKELVNEDGEIVPHLDGENIQDSISVREETAIDGTVIRIHTLPAEYSTLITDITAEVLAKKESDEALQYLNQTDYLIIREMDTGEPCPQEIKDLRAAARLKVIK